MDEIEGASKEFLKSYKQRDEESIIQFVNLVNPVSAAKLISSVHEANEIIHNLQTDTLIISQRGGSTFDWAIKKFNQLLERKPIKTIYLPLGTQRDITHARKRKNTTIAEKVEIAGKIFSSETESIDTLGNITFIDEAKSGTSIVVFLEYILPILKQYKFDSIHVIAMIDEGSPIDQNRTLFDGAREKYKVGINEIVTSLEISDHESFLGTLAHNPQGDTLVPKHIENVKIKAMIELITIGAIYQHELLDLINGHHLPNSDLFKAYQVATSGLNQPEYIHNWLQAYSQKITSLDSRNSKLE